MGFQYRTFKTCAFGRWLPRVYKGLCTLTIRRRKIPSAYFDPWAASALPERRCASRQSFRRRSPSSAPGQRAPRPRSTARCFSSFSSPSSSCRDRLPQSYQATAAPSLRILAPLLLATLLSLRRPTGRLGPVWCRRRLFDWRRGCAAPDILPPSGPLPAARGRT